MRFVLATALALFLAAAVPATVAALAGAPPDPAACEQLASLALADATVTTAKPVAAGAFTPPAGGRGPAGGGRAGAAQAEKPLEFLTGRPERSVTHPIRGYALKFAGPGTTIPSE